MNNLKTYLEELYKTKIDSSGDGDEIRLNQTQRNAIRSKIIDVIYQDFKGFGFDAYRVDKGVAVTFDNEELGGISFILAPTMAAMDYDPAFEEEAYNKKIQMKAEKAAEKAAKTAKKKKEKEEA